MEKIKLGSNVEITISSEQGVVMGIAEYTNTATQYFVHYCDGNGCAKSDWFYIEQLTAV